MDAARLRLLGPTADAASTGNREIFTHDIPGTSQTKAGRTDASPHPPPYASCFTNTRDHVKTTMPIAAHMRRLDQIAYPTFEIQMAHPLGSPAYKDLRPFVEEIVQAEFGPLATKPTRLFADQMYTYHPEKRTLVVLVCVPFPRSPYSYRRRLRALRTARSYLVYEPHLLPRTATSASPRLRFSG